MNTLDIARIMNKRHSDVIRVIRVKFACYAVYACSVSYGSRNMLGYDIPLEELHKLPYGELLLSKIDNEALRIEIESFKIDNEKQNRKIEELENRNKGLEKRRDKLKIEIGNKDWKINQLENALLLKEQTNQSLEKDILLEKRMSRRLENSNSVLEKKNYTLKSNWLKSSDEVDYLTLELRKQQNDNIPECTLQDARTGAQAFHPDKTNRNSDWFMFFNNKKNEIRASA